MMTILLYGFLGKKFGKVHRYDVSNAAEAVRALNATLDGFKQSLIDGGAYTVLRGGKESISEHELHNPQSTKETLRIVPVVEGAKRGGFFGAILGAVIVAVAYLAAPFTGGVSLALAPYGWAMVAGGIAQMLFSPRASGGASNSVEAAENKPSYAFDGAVNTVAQGNPVPVCYGKLLVGSQIISAGLSSEQI